MLKHNRYSGKLLTLNTVTNRLARGTSPGQVDLFFFPGPGVGTELPQQCECERGGLGGFQGLSLKSCVSIYWRISFANCLKSPRFFLRIPITISGSILA